MSFLLTAPADAEPIPERIFSENIDPALLHLKNANRIDEIRCEMGISYRQEIFITNPIARTMRRDWNIVSAKMYVFGLDAQYKGQIKDDLDELHDQVEALLKIVSIDTFSDVDTSWLMQLPLQIKVISPLSWSWLGALKTWDICTARLLTAERLGFIDRKQRMKMLHPVSVAYLGFKSRAMKSNTKSSSEMVEVGYLM